MGRAGYIMDMGNLDGGRNSNQHDANDPENDSSKTVRAGCR